MPWLKVDDKLHDHRKARSAGKAAMGVWVLAGSWSMDHLTDGFIPESVLSRWGNTRDAARLVTAGLWHPAEEHGEKGWQFHNWAEFQPTRAKVQQERAAKVEAGRKGGVNSGASRREAAAKQGASGLVEPPSPSRPHPVPTPVVTDVSRLPAAIDDDGLEQIRTLTGGTKAQAKKTAVEVLGAATGPVRSPLAYVLRSIRNEPDRYRIKRAAPKRDQECTTHPGQWSDNCGGCAADRKAGA